MNPRVAQIVLLVRTICKLRSLSSNCLLLIRPSKTRSKRTRRRRSRKRISRLSHKSSFAGKALVETSRKRSLLSASSLRLNAHYHKLKSKKRRRKRKRSLRLKLEMLALRLTEVTTN